MGAIDLAATMDALAARLTASEVARRVYAFPEESVTVPCAVVGYPTDLDFDLTFKRGGDRTVIPIYMLVGKAIARTARDELSRAIAGAVGVKDAIDGDLGGVVASARVTDCHVEQVDVGGVAYLSATFSVEILT